MIRPKPSVSSFSGLLTRRWVALGYATFALALLVLASIQVANTVGQLSVALFLIVLVIAAPLTGMFLGRGRRERQRPLALGLLLAETAAALGLIALTGGARSPMWVALLLVSTATPLLLRGRWAAGLLVLVWLADGLFLLRVPMPELIPLGLTWALRAAGVGLVGVVLYRALSIEEGVRARSQRRERVLHEFLRLSNRLRVTSQPGQVLEEVAMAVQASGNFDCVTLSQVDWHAGVVNVTVAIGASGRRLTAVEGLQMPWESFAPLLSPSRRVGQSTYRADQLPFRSLRNQRHLVLPLSSQLAEVHGLLTVSAAHKQQDALEEALPLLELLANQAAAALDNTALYSTMEQRVIDATATIERGREELAQARDRAETLYRIVRTLAVTLDEREVLSKALGLLAQATGAERGGIMLVEPTSGRLVFRTACDPQHGVVSGSAAASIGLERTQALAGWVLANRQFAVVNDTDRDTRWAAGPDAGAAERSALAAPLMLEGEPLGVLVLVHSAPEHFREEHGQLAQAAAGQLAVALSKAQLYRYVSEQSERLGITVRQREEEISKTFAILRSIGDGVVVCDRLGRIRMINPAAEAILGVRSQAFLGRQMTDLPGVPFEMQQAQPEGVQQLQVGERSLHAHFAPVRSAGGEWLGGVVVYHDITREVLADRLKSEFIATASHELRTPLTSIRGYVDLLLLGTLGPVSPSQSEFLKVVKTNVARLVELIDDLLDVSKVEAGEIRLRREAVDVAEVLYEVGESLYSQFTERSISLAIDVQQSLPRIMADRQRLRQIAVNLVSNACKYTPMGGHVDITLRNGGNRLRIDIRDTGVGISEDARRYIFTPFFRADNPLRDEVGGTGLGLSITKRLVELHGGEIWFDTNEGSGTTFSFTLPLDAHEWTPAEWLERAESRVVG
ncbi:MAG TPA: ATP-binding protein [Kouleothrix sp.]|uniref:ATP-binding protein n=1 Tax=Kouleothrix sp. TaxID=2779161 RepID=UPI002BB6464D|nr:ATP-binding protein [Kouleothrix sp.]HRC75814.1 ATP-binding protein [Kouleothrix sp.]